MSCEPIEKCSDPMIELAECPKDQIVKATNPSCTDAHQGSDPNDMRGCDSNLIASEVEGRKIDKKGSPAYQKMRAYQRSQNCISIGKATRTSGIRGGYNREAIAMADLRGDNDGRGKDEKTTFTYPGKLGGPTPPNTITGYSHEANAYLQGKKKQGEKDKLRQPDFKTLKEFNDNLNNVRADVTQAALLKDPICGPLSNSLNCTKNCSDLGRNQCSLLHTQCAFTEGLTCDKVVWRKTECYDAEGNTVLCTLDPCDNETKTACVAKTLEFDEIEPIDSDEGKSTGLCAEYKPAEKNGKVVVEGIQPYVREFNDVCYNSKNDVIDCGDDAVVLKAKEPKTEETCKTKNGKDTPCRNSGDSLTSYNENVHTVLISTGDPFYNTLLTADEDGNFISSRVDTETDTGKCDFLELEQLKLGYECCKGQNKFSVLTDFYETKAGLPLSSGNVAEEEVTPPAAPTAPAPTALYRKRTPVLQRI